MVQFFQILFLIAAIVLIVLNVIDFNKWQESRKAGNPRPYTIKWFHFILTSIVALGCMLNIVIGWISKA